MAERVADYPRPPALVSSDAVIEVTALGVLICSTSSSLRVLETFPSPHLLPAPRQRSPRSAGSWPGQELLRVERHRQLLGFGGG